MFLYSFGNHADASWSSESCYLYDLLSITVPQTFHTASNWLTLGQQTNRNGLEVGKTVQLAEITITDVMIAQFLEDEGLGFLTEWTKIQAFAILVIFCNLKKLRKTLSVLTNQTKKTLNSQR